MLHKVALYPDTKDELPKWFSDFANLVISRLDNIESRLDKHDKIFEIIINRIDNLENRIDNLVSKNDLNE